MKSSSPPRFGHRCFSCLPGGATSIFLLNAELSRRGTHSTFVAASSRNWLNLSQFSRAQLYPPRHLLVSFQRGQFGAVQVLGDLPKFGVDLVAFVVHEALDLLPAELLRGSKPMRAEGIGLGWVSILDPAATARILDVPPAWTFIGYFCLGYAAGDSDTPTLERDGWEKRRKPAASIICR